MPAFIRLSKHLAAICTAFAVLLGGLALFSPTTRPPCHSGTARYTSDVVVAATELHSGQRLSRAHIEVKSVPMKFLPSSAIEEKHLDRILGKEIRNDVHPGDLLVDTDFDGLQTKPR